MPDPFGITRTSTLKDNGDYVPPELIARLLCTFPYVVFRKREKIRWMSIQSIITHNGFEL